MTAITLALVVAMSLGGFVTAGPVPAPTSGVVLDIPALVGKTASQVAAVLGKPTEVQAATCAGSPCPRHLYTGGKVEIVFVRGKADWITVYPANLPFEMTSLGRLGLPVSADSGTALWLGSRQRIRPPCIGTPVGAAH